MVTPVLMVKGENIPEVWENSVKRTWEEGAMKYTEYDQWSRDCTMLMIVRHPFAEPRIHRGGICGSLNDLKKYVMEVKII